jgi:hypothetical protein
VELHAPAEDKSELIFAQVLTAVPLSLNHVRL